MAETNHKQVAAEHAVASIESGMVVGLGAGSTAAYAVRRLGALLADGTLRDVRGVPCSAAVERLARAAGIPLLEPHDAPAIDLTIDGADEVDPALDLVKGAGGAMLREKVVAQESRREIIVVDASKLSPRLGTNAALPVEVVPFAQGAVARFLASLGARVTPRRKEDGAPFETDSGNHVLDCRFGPIDDAHDLARRLEARAGVVAHGLFLGLATEVIVSGDDGVRVLRRKG